MSLVKWLNHCCMYWRIILMNLSRNSLIESDWVLYWRMKWLSVWSRLFTASWLYILNSITNCFLFCIVLWSIVIFLMYLVPRLFNVTVWMFLSPTVVLLLMQQNDQSLRMYHLISLISYFSELLWSFGFTLRLLLTPEAARVFSSSDSFRKYFDSE